MPSGSKKKAPRYVCLSEAKASHSQRMYAEVSSSAPHLLHSGLSSSPSRWRCLLRVLCPVRKPVTTLDWVLLKDKNLALAPRQGPKISSRAWLCVSPRPRHRTQCWLINQRLILLRITCLEPPRDGAGPRKPRIETPLASSSAISLPRPPACPGTQYSLTACQVEISFNAFLALLDQSKTPYRCREYNQELYTWARSWLVTLTFLVLSFNLDTRIKRHAFRTITPLPNPSIFSKKSCSHLGRSRASRTVVANGSELAAHSPKVLYRQYCTAVTMTDRNWQRTARRFCTSSTAWL